MTASQWLSNHLADVIVAIAQANATLAAQSQPAVVPQPQEVSPNE
jgi:hypothetical protein